MYPVLFRLGGLETTSFGVMLAVAALAGLWLFRRELPRSGLILEEHRLRTCATESA